MDRRKMAWLGLVTLFFMSAIVSCHSSKRKKPGATQTEKEVPKEKTSAKLSDEQWVKDVFSGYDTTTAPASGVGKHLEGLTLSVSTDRLAHLKLVFGCSDPRVLDYSGSFKKKNEFTQLWEQTKQKGHTVAIKEGQLDVQIGCETVECKRMMVSLKTLQAGPSLGKKGDHFVFVLKGSEAGYKLSWSNPKNITSAAASLALVQKKITKGLDCQDASTKQTGVDSAMTNENVTPQNPIGDRSGIGDQGKKIPPVIKPKVSAVDGGTGGNKIAAKPQRKKQNVNIKLPENMRGKHNEVFSGKQHLVETKENPLKAVKQKANKKNSPPLWNGGEALGSEHFKQMTSIPTWKKFKLRLMEVGFRIDKQAFSTELMGESLVFPIVPAGESKEYKKAYLSFDTPLVKKSELEKTNDSKRELETESTEGKAKSVGPIYLGEFSNFYEKRQGDRLILHFEAVYGASGEKSKTKRDSTDLFIDLKDGKPTWISSRFYVDGDYDGERSFTNADWVAAAKIDPSQVVYAELVDKLVPSDGKSFPDLTAVESRKDWETHLGKYGILFTTLSLKGLNFGYILHLPGEQVKGRAGNGLINWKRSGSSGVDFARLFDFRMLEGDQFVDFRFSMAYDIFRMDQPKDANLIEHYELVHLRINTAKDELSIYYTDSTRPEDKVELLIHDLSAEKPYILDFKDNLQAWKKELNSIGVFLQKDKVNNLDDIEIYIPGMTKKISRLISLEKGTGTGKGHSVGEFENLKILKNSRVAILEFSIMHAGLVGNSNLNSMVDYRIELDLIEQLGDVWAKSRFSEGEHIGTQPTQFNGFYSFLSDFSIIREETIGLLNYAPDHVKGQFKASSLMHSDLDKVCTTSVGSSEVQKLHFCQNWLVIEADSELELFTEFSEIRDFINMEWISVSLDKEEKSGLARVSIVTKSQSDVDPQVNADIWWGTSKSGKEMAFDKMAASASGSHRKQLLDQNFVEDGMDKSVLHLFDEEEEIHLVAQLREDQQLYKLYHNLDPKELQQIPNAISSLMLAKVGDQWNPELELLAESGPFFYLIRPEKISPERANTTVDFRKVAIEYIKPWPSKRPSKGSELNGDNSVETGFKLGARNSTETVKKLKDGLNGLSMQDVSAKLQKSIPSCDHGAEKSFLQAEGSVYSEMVMANQTVVDELNMTHQIIGKALLLAIQMAKQGIEEFNYGGKRLRVLSERLAEECDGPLNLRSAFDRSEGKAKNLSRHHSVSLLDVDSEEVLTFKEILADYIYTYGFYGQTGDVSSNFLDPKILVKFFGLGTVE